ncbi:hypothetical protein ACSVCE_08200 [Chromobacterium haemolyticum]|uniref:hypothetical protein n=1 Tax=Chromobacterium haemolyticum TaxID=394935 RepID=UPI0040556C75
MKISSDMLSRIHPRGCADPDTPPQTALAADIRSAVNNSARPSAITRSSPHAAPPTESARRLVPDTLQGILAQAQRQFSLWLAGRPQEDAHNLLRNYYTSIVHDHIDNTAEAVARQCLPQAPSSRLAEQAKHYRSFVIDTSAARFPSQAEYFRKQAGPSLLNNHLRGISTQAGLNDKDPKHQAALKQLVEHCAVQLAVRLQQLSPLTLRDTLEQARCDYLRGQAPEHAAPQPEQDIIAPLPPAEAILRRNKANRLKAHRDSRQINFRRLTGFN